MVNSLRTSNGHCAVVLGRRRHKNEPHVTPKTSSIRKAEKGEFHVAAHLLHSRNQNSNHSSKAQFESPLLSVLFVVRVPITSLPPPQPLLLFDLVMESPASVRTTNIYTPSTVASSDDGSNSNLTYRIVSIEGNIGSGKTTLLSNIKSTLQNRKDIIFLKEPVDEWDTIRDKEGNTMLQKFYGDQEKYSFPFQMMAYITRLNLLRNTIRSHPNAIIITERSLYVSSNF